MAGPAYPLFRSSLHFSLSPSLIGSACHCGRSRLFFPPFYLPHPPRPFISLSSIGPACHCGRSRQFLISPLLSKFFHLLYPPSLSYRPGLSLWQVSPYHRYLTNKNQHFISLPDLPKLTQILTNPYKPSRPSILRIITDLHRSSLTLTEPHTHTALYTALYSQYTIKKPQRSSTDPQRPSQIPTDP